MYQPTETQTSQQQLQAIFKQLKGDACLLGGWAVHYLVNENYEKATGRTYIGSRDIDLGFHINKQWNKQQLENSEFAAAIETIENMGFQSVSFRLVKDFNIDTGKELTPTESAKLPMHQIFQMYIDPIVDYIHPEIKNLLGFVPIDEPLLSFVFQEKLYNKQLLFEKEVIIPKPHVLLAMKINSAPRRDKQNKLIKDIADIYALLWHSNTKLPQLKKQLTTIIPSQQVRKTLHGFTKEEIATAAATLGIDTSQISRVIKQVI